MNEQNADRILDPMLTPALYAQRQRGVDDLADLERRLALLEKYNDRSPLEAFPIGWSAPTQGANQTITSTSYTLITGSTFELSFAGADESTWLSMLLYRGVVASTGVIDDDVYMRILIDWGDGTFREPDIDTDVPHGAVTAFGPQVYGESAATTAGFSLLAPATLKVRGGSTIRVALAARIGSGSTSADIALTSVPLAPHCVGFAMPFRRVR